MVNVNYRRGRGKEYRLMGMLREKKYDIVFRTAGSHSPIDVIGIRKGEIIFIQSKPKRFSKNKKKGLEDKYGWLNNMFKCKFEIV
jgi:Holliday junction resolvase